MIFFIEDGKVAFDIDSEPLADECELPVVEEFQDFSISTL